jgi:hypothetical protein
LPRHTPPFTELARHLGGDTEVDLVGRSTIEETMGHHRVVLLDVEGDKAFDRGG